MAVRLTRPSDDDGCGPFAISTSRFPPAPGVVDPSQPSLSQEIGTEYAKENGNRPRLEAVPCFCSLTHIAFSATVASHR